MQRRLTLLLFIAAAARLILHMAAMPPYAGLDEVYHVARLAFVLQEHRNPAVAEKSVPPYLEGSMSGDPRDLPAFCLVGPRWPEVVRSRAILVDRPLVANDVRPYTRVNYEVQQPSLYYSLVAPLARLLPQRTAIHELRLWRAVSLLFALVSVLATARIGGVLAAATIVMLPTWFTLVVRASNDAMACAFVAVAIAVTAVPLKRGAVAVEATAWAVALATKLYTWPLAILLPVFWRRQRATKARMAVVCGVCAIAVLLTVIDLNQRTRNPLGHFGFDRPNAAAANTPAIRIVDMVKITIASGIWTSGQHNDAMRPIAMAIYVLPIIALVAMRRPKDFNPLLVALLVFAAAQAVDAIAFARQARAAGLDLPLGGKEGWYWYVLAPLAAATLFRGAPRLIAGWLLVWDVVIHEVALFHDFAGTTSPAHPSALFRWGPLQAPFTADLASIGVGPLAAHLVILRAIEVAAVLALFLQGSSSDDRHSVRESSRAVRVD